jgi:homoserine kinase type II
MDDRDAAMTRALTRVVATAWPMASPTRLTPLTTGQNSLVYRVAASAGPPRILRVYRNHADVARVHHELALLAALRDASLPFAVPAPVATRAGALVHQLPDDDDLPPRALVVLWTEMAGTHPDPADAAQAEAGGAALAQLDRALAAIDATALPGRATPPVRELRRRVSAPEDVEAAILRLPFPAADTASLVEQLISSEEMVPPLYASLPQQLVHGDIDPSNVLMDGARVTGLLDFEFAHHDLRIWDLVVPLSWWHPDLFGTGAEWGVMDALGRGYAAHLPLRPGEARALPLLFRLRTIGGLLRTLAWHRQGRVGEARVLERAAYTLERERWLRRHEPRLLAMAEQWPQER